MGGSASRRKGSNAEREFRDVLRAHGVDAHRIPRSGADKDLPWRGDVRGLDDWHCEVKRTERLNIHAALRQAKDDCPDHQKPLVAFRRNRDPWRVVIDLYDFLELLGLEQDESN